MKTRIFSIAMLVLVCFTAQRTEAAFDYSLEAADASNIDATLGAGAFDFSTIPGGVGTLNLYLVQRNMAAAITPSQIINFNLTSTGTISSITPSEGTASFTFNTINSIAGGTTFSNFNFAGTTDSTEIGTTGLQGWNVGSITVGGSLGQASAFSFGSLGGDSINVDGSNITASVTGSNFTVAVPEPSSALLLGVFGIGAVLRRRRA